MEKIKIIKTDKAPKAIGPYSQAVMAGTFLFVSGQIPIKPDTGEIPDGIEQQTKQVMENIRAILKSAEPPMEFDRVVKTTIYLKNMDDFKTVNEIYGSYFTQNYPARATVEVSRLPRDIKVEIDAIVYAGR